MSNVFLKNTTSTAITVAGYTVHYIDSTDAEIVEVEKTGPLEILLGFAWNNDETALEAIDISNTWYWSRVISQHDKELLQSLGLFVDVDFLKYGSLKKDSSYTYTVIGVYTGIGEGEIETDLSHFTVGVSSSHPTYNNVAYIQCDTSVPLLVKTWKCRVSINVTVKYNAFKYTLNGTPYWYVIDGTHESWTDDLSSIGYSEVPSVVLPTVDGYTGFVNTSQTAGSISPSSSIILYKNSSGDRFPYDSSKVYASGVYYESSSDVNSLSAIYLDVGFVSGWSSVMLTNQTSSAAAVQRIQFATCSSSLATVITVYNTSNVAYNAFKYTANNTDYYYVLDGTQTDWTDDLASIGYAELVTSYFRTDKGWQTLQSYNDLYDDAGNRVAYQTGKTYTLKTLVENGNYLMNSNGWLQFHYNGSSSVSAMYVRYTVS